MSTKPTPPRVRELILATKRLFRRAIENADLSLAHVADHLDRSDTVTERWVNERSLDKNAPLYILAHPTAVTDAAFEAIVSALRAARAQASAPPAEEAAADLIGRVGETLGELGRVLADKRVDAPEARALRQCLAALRAQIDTTDRSLANTESAS